MLERFTNAIDVRSMLAALPGCHLFLLPDAPRYTIVDATDAYLAATYCQREKIIGQGVFESLTDNPQNPQATGVKNLSASLRQVLEHKREHRMADQRYDVYNPTAAQFEPKVWRPVNKPVLGDEGDVQYIIHTVEDITEAIRLQEETKVADQKLEESETKFHSVIEQASNPILIFKGTEMVLEEANEALFRIWNLDRSVIGKSILDIHPQTREEGFFALLQKVFFSGVPEYGIEVPATFSDNGSTRTVYFNFTYQAIRDSSGTITGVLVMAHDVTEQVHARKAIECAQAETERQKRLYEAITSSTPDLIYVFDLEYRFTYANKALLTTWGKSWEEAIGKGMPENGYEDWHTEMHQREIDQVVTTKEPIRGEVTFPHAVLGNRIYDYIFVPVVNEKGDVEAVVGTTRDITEIKRAEDVLKQGRENLETLVSERTQELERSNGELEGFAYAASHDLKEPIRKIHFFADRLKERLNSKLEEEDRRYFERLEMGTKRMTSLIDDLLLYSHVSRGVSSVETADLNQTLSFVLDDLELHIEEKRAKIDVDPLPVLMDHQRQLQQLFENLIANALKYSKPGVAPQISITSGLVSGADIAPPNASISKNKAYHFIQVRDNGIGFDQKDAERIFNVFTRLHGNNEYRGTGVGLSIALKVVQNHQGYIWAEGKPNEGSTFKILLPAEA
jgi:PAS domain S-box-containing protein